MARTHEFSFSGNPDFDFEIRTTIGQAYSGAADIGEVIAAVHGVGDKDHEGWFRAWLALGDRIAAEGEASAAAGHAVSAASASSARRPTTERRSTPWPPWSRTTSCCRPSASTVPRGTAGWS
ncbi:hypothetical protein ACRAWC_22370 [Leifsonia sp. L25]|uniref:hypothetical protein n=1 Tax=Leifsonia TaxID=110932 RepID=UPI003D67040B